MIPGVIPQRVYSNGDRVIRRSKKTGRRSVGIVEAWPNDPQKRTFIFWHERGPASELPRDIEEITLGECDAVDWFFLRGDIRPWQWPRLLIRKAWARLVGYVMGKI